MTADHKPNVIVVVLDCARAKNFSHSGNGATARTPHIDALAARGVAYSRAVAPSNWTLPSHASIFTGLYPFQHGLRTYRRPIDWPSTTADRLRSFGFSTFLITENVQLTAGYGVENGFDYVYPEVAKTKPVDRIFGIRERRRSSLYSPRVARALARVPPLVAPIAWPARAQEIMFKRAVCGPTLLSRFDSVLGRIPPTTPVYSFFNFLDTHNPYDIVADGKAVGLLNRTYLYAPRAQLLMVPKLMERIDWEPMVRGYIRSIELADEKIGRLLDVLKRHDRLAESVVIVTGDHGQQFGEFGVAYHASGFSDAVARVPLVIRPPSGYAGGKLVREWTSLCELDRWTTSVVSDPAFLQRWLDSGGAISQQSQDRAVYCDCAAISDANRSLSEFGRDRVWNRRTIAAYVGEQKYVLDVSSGEIYVWSAGGDPDLSPQTPVPADARVRVRQEVFSDFDTAETSRLAREAAGPQASEISIDARLRSWGYD